MFTVSAEQLQTAVPILMYHSVCNRGNNAYVISPSTFSKDLDYLNEHNFTPILMRDLIDYTENSKMLPNKPILITLDDGFYNNYSTVFPIIKEKNFKCLISVVGSYIERGEVETQHNNYYSLMNWANATEMVNSGLCEIQNHSYKMHSISNFRKGVRKSNSESDQQYIKAFTEDTLKCESLIENHCKVKPTTFTYPFGYYSKSTPQILKEMGYKAILTCESGVNYIGKGDSLLNLKRFNRPTKYTTEYFMEKVCKLK